MADLTRYEMEGLMLDHEKAELEYDLDSTMASLVPNPHFEIAFLGLAIDGYDAVRELYRRMINFGAKEWNFQAVARVIAEAKNTLIREAHISFDKPEGGRVTGQYIVVMEFDPQLKKIVGERMYADTVYADLMTGVIGDDLVDVPGITRLSDHAPVINVHDAFALAASRGVTIDHPLGQQ